ncbi:MAG: alpha/beta hydrolase-fold protein [Ruthenibacterium sp.]
MTHLDINFFSSVFTRTQRMRVMLPRPDMVLPPEGPAVLYLLHGFSDGCDSFLQNSALARYCDDLPLCIVMPDADKSFYANMRFGDAYWTHISQEVPDFIQKTFRVNTAPDKTFVGGVSMGGYGAIKFMLQKPCSEAFLFSPATDVIATMNGRVKQVNGIQPFTPEQLSLQNVFDPEKIAGSEDDLLSVLRNTTKKLPHLHIYCGREDFLYDEIQVFCNLLNSKGQSFEYTESDGGHCWATWEQYFAEMADILRERLLKKN